MTTSKLWRYALIGAWVLYVIMLIRVVGVLLGADTAAAMWSGSYDAFSTIFAVPVGIGTLALLVLQRRRPEAERAAYRTDERKQALFSRAAKTSFWMLLFGNVVALSQSIGDEWRLLIVTLVTIATFGVIFLMATADEFAIMRLEAEAN